MINDTKMTLTLGKKIVKNSILKSSHHSKYCQQIHQANTTHQLHYPAVLLSFPSLMLQQTMSVFKVHQRDSHAPHIHTDGSSKIFKACLCVTIWQP